MELNKNNMVELYKIHFREEKGYLMSLHVTTLSIEDGDYKFESTITDDSGFEIGKFKHVNLIGRLHWVDGFYTALKMVNEI